MQLLMKGFEVNSKINEEWIKKNCYIAGGCCVSQFTRKPINDVDLYFKTKEARDEFIKEVGGEHYISKDDEMWKALLQCESLTLDDEPKQIGDYIISSGTDFKENPYYVIETFDKKGYVYTAYEIPYELFKKQKWMFENGYDYVLLARNHYEVENRYFLGNKSITIIEYPNNTQLKYQFILRFYGEPNEMMNNTFDFQHCKIAYDLATNEYIASQETWECLSKREIKYVNSFYPVSSMKRLYKYSNRGFSFDTREFAKIIKDIHEVDVNNKFVLEDQILGYYEDFDYDMVFNNEILINKW